MSDPSAQWLGLSLTLGLADGPGLWRALAQAYGEPHRHYHAMSHIAAVMDGFERVRGRFEDAAAAQLALFYHDIVYDPARSDNEAMSAERLTRDLPGLDTARACHHILATKRHDLAADPDTNLVLDIDMAILGASWDTYLAYARNVAREYVPVYGAEAYAAGRVALFLNPTLERDHIFLTAEFAALDEPARRNLAAERDLWQSGEFGGI